MMNRPSCTCTISLSGTHYDRRTPADVIAVLERLLRSDTRVRLHYGDAAGRDWGDVYNVTGRIGRTPGPCRAPILLDTGATPGGRAFNASTLVRIRYANREHGGDLYRHPQYRRPIGVAERDRAAFA